MHGQTFKYHAPGPLYSGVQTRPPQGSFVLGGGGHYIGGLLVFLQVNRLLVLCGTCTVSAFADVCYRILHVLSASSQSQNMSNRRYHTLKVVSMTNVILFSPPGRGFYTGGGGVYKIDAVRTRWSILCSHSCHCGCDGSLGAYPPLYRQVNKQQG